MRGRYSWFFATMWPHCLISLEVRDEFYHLRTRQFIFQTFRLGFFGYCRLGFMASPVWGQCQGFGFFGPLLSLAWIIFNLMRLAIWIKLVDVYTIHLSKNDHVWKRVKESTRPENKMGFKEHISSYTRPRTVVRDIEFQHGEETGCQPCFVQSSNWCQRLIYGRRVRHSLKCCVLLVLSG
jgi:hypothetical protein